MTARSSGRERSPTPSAFSSVRQGRNLPQPVLPTRESATRRSSVRVLCSTRCSGNMRPGTSRATASFSSSLENCSRHIESRAMYRFLEGTVEKYMTRAVRTVTRQTTMRDLEALFEKYDFNSFPVVEEEKMLGIVSKFDFLRAFAFTTGQMLPHYDELMRRPVAEVMTEAVVHVEPTAPLTRVLQLMVSLKNRSFPVIGHDRQLVGIISREDVIRALKEATQDVRETR